MAMRDRTPASRIQTGRKNGKQIDRKSVAEHKGLDVPGASLTP